MIEWPKKLVKDIARRACVLYIGAGISANARSSNGQAPLTWDKFLKNCIEHIQDEESKEYAKMLLEHKDMLNACEVIINTLGEHVFFDCTSNTFRRPGFTPVKIHEEIYKLDSRLVITPNVDNIYDQYAFSTSKGTILIKKYDDPDLSNFLRSQDRVILKAHGSVETPKRMIFHVSNII